MRQLDVLESTDDLYEARGDVPPAFPMMQGDVFCDVPVPGLSDKPMVVTIVTHPCSMRSGASLRSRLTVAPVASTSQRINEDMWLKYGNYMPLPELYGDGKGYLVDFRDVAPASTTDLHISNRVANLSRLGILLLQQRYAFAHTRYAVEIPVLADVSQAVFLETELQYDWVEAALVAAGSPTTDVYSAAELAIKSFQDWLDENDKERRKRLHDPLNSIRLRRAVREEAARRFVAQ